MTRRSLAAAVKAKCKECIYDPIAPGTWLQQVAECSSSNCPLHSVRPLPLSVKKAQNRPDNDEAAPAAADDAGEDVSTLLGGIFGPQS